RGSRSRGAAARRRDHDAGPVRRVRRATVEVAGRTAVDPARAACPARGFVRPDRCEASVRLRLALEVLGLLVLAAVIAVVPQLVADYTTYEFALVGTFFIALLGLALLTGHSGQISLGHGAFMAIG